MIIDKTREISNYLFFVVVMVFYFSSVLGLIILMNTSQIFMKNNMVIHKYLKRAWIHITMFSLSIYFPKPIYICYDPRVLNKEKNIIISNHLTEYDWLIILSILYKLKRYNNVCIILKNSLRKIPLLGYGMEYFGFIFLNRKIKYDEEILNKGLERLKSKQKYDLLLFPEGTYIDSVGKQLSDKYIENNPVYIENKKFKPKEVLLPRITGFNICRENLQEDMDGVVNITLLVNPYTELPQEVYTYSKVLTDFKDRVGFVMYITYQEDIKEPDYIYREFKKKDEIIKKYKNLFFREIKSLQEFQDKSTELFGNVKGFDYDIIYVASKYEPIFKTVLIFTCLLFLYLIYVYKK